MSDPFVGEIRIFPFSFAPKGWAFCSGQLMPISQNTALFSLLGTYYGGDGKSTFALPDMQGNVPVQQGQGQGLSLYDLGEQGGVETVTLLQTEMPLHTHNVLNAPTLGSADTNVVTANSFGKSANGNAYLAPAALTQMAFQAVSLAGGGLPHNNLMPYLTLNYCIALQGIFPPRP